MGNTHLMFVLTTSPWLSTLPFMPSQAIMTLKVRVPHYEKLQTPKSQHAASSFISETANPFFKLPSPAFR